MRVTTAASRGAESVATGEVERFPEGIQILRRSNTRGGKGLV
jgi:hypothetical protein